MGYKEINIYNITIMARNNKHRMTSKSKKQHHLKEIHNGFLELCKDNYNKKRNIYNTYKSIGINKNNNVSQNQIFKLAMFFKAIIDKDKVKFQELYEEIKNQQFIKLEQGEHYDGEKNVILGYKDELSPIQNEGDYVNYCKLLKKQTDDLDKFYKNTIRIPNWF